MRAGFPRAASLQLGRAFRGTRTWAMVFGRGSVPLGLMASYLLDIAPGGTIILTFVLVFIIPVSDERSSAWCSDGRDPLGVHRRATTRCDWLLQCPGVICLYIAL